MEGLSSAVELFLRDERTKGRVDLVLAERLPRKTEKEPHHNIRKNIEERFLIPSQGFSIPWLDELQE